MQSLSSGWARAESCAGDSASKQKLEVNCKDNFTLIFTLLPNSVKLIGLKKKNKERMHNGQGKNIQVWNQAASTMVVFAWSNFLAWSLLKVEASHEPTDGWSLA